MKLYLVFSSRHRESGKVELMCDGGVRQQANGLPCELGGFHVVVEGDSILERSTAENGDHVVAERENDEPDLDVQ